METTDLRTEFTKETKTRFNIEWIVYNDYVDWLEQRLVKLLTIPPVIKSADSIEEIVNCEYFDKGFCVVCKCNDCKGQRCKVYDIK
jgi:hypothetical protein